MYVCIYIYTYVCNYIVYRDYHSMYKLSFYDVHYILSNDSWTVDLLQWDARSPAPVTHQEPCETSLTSPSLPENMEVLGNVRWLEGWGDGGRRSCKLSNMYVIIKQYIHMSHVYVYIYIYTCIHMYVCIYIYKCVYIYIYIYMYVCIYIYKYIYTHVYFLLCIHTYMEVS